MQPIFFIVKIFSGVLQQFTDKVGAMFLFVLFRNLKLLNNYYYYINLMCQDMFWHLIIMLLVMSLNILRC